MQFLVFCCNCHWKRFQSTSYPPYSSNARYRTKFNFIYFLCMHILFYLGWLETLNKSVTIYINNFTDFGNHRYCSRWKKKPQPNHQNQMLYIDCVVVCNRNVLRAGSPKIAAMLSVCNPKTNETTIITTSKTIFTIIRFTAFFFLCANRSSFHYEFCSIISRNTVWLAN